jgi:hypothetical protein
LQTKREGGFLAGTAVWFRAIMMFGASQNYIDFSHEVYSDESININALFSMIGSLAALAGFITSAFPLINYLASHPAQK